MTCRNGHDLSDPAVVRVLKDGRRRCRRCQSAAEKRYNELHPDRQLRYANRRRRYMRQYMRELRRSQGLPERPVMGPWTESEVANLVSMWQAGRSAAQISDALRRTCGAIYRRLWQLRGAGVEIEVRGHQTEEVKARRAERRAEERAEMQECELAIPDPPARQAVAAMLPKFAHWADGIHDSWSDDQPIGGGKMKGVSLTSDPILDLIKSTAADLLVAFPGGRGTADMVRRARAAGVPVEEVGRG